MMTSMADFCNTKNARDTKSCLNLICVTMFCYILFLSMCLCAIISFVLKFFIENKVFFNIVSHLKNCSVILQERSVIIFSSGDNLSSEFCMIRKGMFRWNIVENESMWKVENHWFL